MKTERDTQKEREGEGEEEGREKRRGRERIYISGRLLEQFKLHSSNKCHLAVNS